VHLTEYVYIIGKDVKFWGRMVRVKARGVSDVLKIALFGFVQICRNLQRHAHFLSRHQIIV